MHRKTLAGIAVAAAACTLTLAATAEPRLLLPGDAQLTPARITDHEAAYAIIAILPDGTERTLQQVHRTIARQGERMVVTWETDVQGIHIEDRAEAEAGSLRLLAHAAATQHEGGIAVQHLEYGTRAAAHLASPAGERLEGLEAKLEGPLFPGAMASVILLALPLEEGAEFRWPVPRRDLSGNSEIQAKVEGRETIALGDGSVDAWRVLVTAETGPATVWVADEAPYIVRKEYATPQAKLIWQPAG